MVSQRRAARAGMGRPPVEESPPEWLWRFSPQAWVDERACTGEDATVAALVAARRRWRGQRDAWLEERGLVVWGMRGLSHDEFKRIEQQEPHRVLRRPDA
ncbi:hypothetical protein ACGFNV_22125 [Streptomyces sp. NPDC048751]|uniref:hypothetical protein n=1 Tax=Streptomyces sp. NPDC048751 TaxID=3365591 RepID=UPI003716A9AC